MEQLTKFEKKFYELSGLEQKKIQNQTGCLLPCRYNEYKIVDVPIPIGVDNLSIQLLLATTTVLVKTEELFYPFESFLAEFGGALGLFLGFSFMMAWDVFQTVLKLFMSKRK